MQQEYFNQLKELLTKLKNNQGHFIIQNGKMDAENSGGNGYYCQLVKDSPKDLIRFEAVSHYFEKSLNKNLKPKFAALGFSLEKDENYAKDILLNSDRDVENTASEIVQIFEEIYNSDEHSVYDFDDQIEAIPEKPKKRKTTSNPAVSQPVQPPATTPKLSGRAWILIISLAIVGYVTFFGDDNKKSSSSKEVVYNSEWDASVQQVVDYLKSNYLNDPDSYKAVEWSNVVKLNDTKQVGFASYQVRHKYRAKNAFGGYITEEKLFKFDYQGNIVEVRDWMR
ncbi:MAG: hypothetical protein GXC72_01745 [Chitinophagaceae bacterium]|nr:hypothetical protein [Chitinophagaceae bacterium]